MPLAPVASGMVDPAPPVTATLDRPIAAFERAAEAPPAAMKLQIRLG